MEPRFSASALARFWAKVDRSGECWLWTAGVFAFGYGCFWHRGHMDKAHRVSYELAYGPPPKGDWILHTCDVPACVRPEHLYSGGPAENGRDKRDRNRDHRSRNRGEQNARAKLTANKVRGIRTRYAAGGISTEALGTEYGVCGALVSMILTGKRWAHVI